MMFADVIMTRIWTFAGDRTGRVSRTGRTPNAGHFEQRPEYIIRRSVRRFDQLEAASATRQQLYHNRRPLDYFRPAAGTAGHSRLASRVRLFGGHTANSSNHDRGQISAARSV